MHLPNPPVVVCFTEIIPLTDLWWRGLGGDRHVWDFFTEQAPRTSGPTGAFGDANAAAFLVAGVSIRAALARKRRERREETAGGREDQEEIVTISRHGTFFTLKCFSRRMQRAQRYLPYTQKIQYETRGSNRERKKRVHYKCVAHNHSSTMPAV